MDLEGKKIIISGGAGFLGRHIIKKYHDIADITVVSRDESKHYYLKKQYPRIRTKICDIRNFDLLNRITEGHEIGIWAASMKQIEACDSNVEEAKSIILDGALNSRRASEENYLESAVFISTDKSRAPTTLYGYLKGAAGESFILNPALNTKLSSVIYGNVLNSTGSVIPMIWKAILNGTSMTLYHEEMTRFMITVEDAIHTIEYSLDKNGTHVIPALTSFRILDLFELYAKKYGLKFSVGKPRIGEKLHEILISRDDSIRCVHLPIDKLYLLTPQYMQPHDKEFEYSSKNTVLAKDSLEELLEYRNYYQPKANNEL